MSKEDNDQTLAEAKPEPEEPKEPVKEERKDFICHLCKLYSKYVYYGTRPLERHWEKSNAGQSKPNPRRETMILLENAFVTDDPFSELKSNNFLILGAKCHICDKMVCVASECSLFYYNKRFCIKCATESLTTDEFPTEIKTELIKIIQNSKSDQN